MDIPRSYMLRYEVSGYKMVNSEKEYYLDHFHCGRDAYIFHSYLKREGYIDVKIKVK